MIYQNGFEVNDPCNREDIPDEDCRECKGDGYIYEVEDWLDPNCPIEKNKCERCDGTGKVEPEY